MDFSRDLPVSDARSVASCSEPLPPFAIRELNGPAEDGTVQLTPSQYDSTITSYPDATLTYLDEDDGETVTVGSSLELQERLEEPVRPKRKHRRRSDPLSRSIDSDQKIHIFDINRTAENLLVWRDHAAYSSKTLREDSEPTSALPMFPVQTDSSLAQVQNSPKDTSVPAPFTHVEAKPLPVREQRTGPAPAIHSDDVLKGIDDILQTACRGFESHIGGFAAFLDLTAGALRTAAEKTRQADTTPVEDFLSGMKTVLVEAGQMGLELLRELEINEPAPPTASSPSAEHETDPPSPAGSAQAPSSETSSNCISFSTPGARLSSISDASLRSVSPSQDQVASLVGTQSDNVETSDSSSTRVPVTKESPADIITFQQPSSKPNHSLMDIDAWNEDFAVRYPPLSSLRRAKTVGSLRKPAEAEVQRESGDDSKATLSRYPTIGQINRTNREERIARPRGPNRTSLFPRHVSPESVPRPVPSSQQYKSPNVEDVNDATGTIISTPTNRGSSNTITNDHQGLPGAWPERTTAAGDSGATESPGKFIEHMMRPSAGIADNTQPRSPTLSCRTTSPLADPFHPAVSALRRARTVTASNPAARLNGPFDPLSGAPGPLDEAAGPTRDPFSQFTLPQRSLTQHLPSGPPRPTFRDTYGPLGRGPRPAQHGPPRMPGAFPYPPVPQPRATPADHHFLRHMQSEPNFAPPATRPTTDPGVTDCISSLRAMGYGSGDANEDARLPMYASATFGNVSEAVEMIEEDRRAAKAILSRV